VQVDCVNSSDIDSFTSSMTRFQDGAFDSDAGVHVFPQRDQQLSRERHNRRLTKPSADACDAFLEPLHQR
jgi:hypothetical protein